MSEASLCSRKCAPTKARLRVGVAIGMAKTNEMNNTTRIKFRVD